MGKGSSVTRSVRIDTDIDEGLRRLATEGGVSVNFLTSKALRRFVEWDAYGAKFGFIDMPGPILVKMVEFLADEQVKELGRWVGATLLREYVTFWFKEVTIETVLEAFPRLVSKYGRLFQFEELDERGRKTVILKHGSGPRMSLLYHEIARAAFTELLKTQSQVESTENQVVIRLPSFETSRLPPVTRLAAARE
jgi:hypothetical protein